MGVLGRPEGGLQVKLGCGGSLMENVGREERAVRNGKQRSGVQLCRSGGEGQRLHVTGVW